MNKRKIILLMVLVGLSLSTSIFAENTNIEIRLEGKELSIPKDHGEVFIDSQSRTIIPLRIISEKLGHKVEWEGSTGTVTIDGGVSIAIGDNVVNTPNGLVKMDTKAILKGGRTFVPLRFVVEALGYEIKYDGPKKSNEYKHMIDILQKNDTKGEAEERGKIEVHFIDVGQGDSILIKQGDGSMLIDAGDNSYGETVVNYLKDKGVDSLDYLIGTHPHADHIGGLDDVIKAIDVKKVIMPKVTHTTKSFEDVIRAIQGKGLKVRTPIVGDVYELGGASFTILGPSSDHYDNLNNYSIALRIEFGNNSFLFTGDAETESENEILDSGLNIESDVLKLGHHGSTTSSKPAFVKKVNPEYAVIMVGENNRYNHPDNIVLNRMKLNDITVYRTDIDGTIIAIGDGEDIRFEFIRGNAVDQ